MFPVGCWRASTLDANTTRPTSVRNIGFTNAP
jgi:hypothetical protein